MEWFLVGALFAFDYIYELNYNQTWKTYRPSKATNL